eukprot:3394873-Pleurochrysis_carterae.AAC.1
MQTACCEFPFSSERAVLAPFARLPRGADSLSQASLALACLSETSVGEAIAADVADLTRLVGSSGDANGGDGGTGGSGASEEAKGSDAVAHGGVRPVLQVQMWRSFAPARPSRIRARLAARPIITTNLDSATLSVEFVCQLVLAAGRVLQVF